MIRYEEKFLHLMEFIEASELSGASFSSTDVGFSLSEQSDHTKIGKRRNKVSSIAETELEILLGEMHKLGLIKGIFTKTDISNVQLVYNGRIWLQDYRSNRLSLRVARWFARQVDKVFSSIFLPVVAAILTVWALNYFDLNNIGKPLAPDGVQEGTMP